MQFNSYEFILVFMPLVVGGYFITNKVCNGKIGNVFLLLMSIVYYSFAGIKFLGLLLFGVLMNYAVAMLIKKTGKRPALVCGIIFNVALMVCFKYYNFFINNINAAFQTEFSLKNIILPLGISFYTFQQIAYLVSVYKGKMEHLGFGEYALYILYFPKLIMGPLIEPKDFIVQIRDSQLKRFDLDNFMVGIRRFNIGLLKKLLFAQVFADVVTWGFSNLEVASSLDLIIVMLSYTFEIYFDFSGYIDMAIGVSQMLNITLPINFSSPYQAFSMRDFWKRWHMSLTNFLTRYIYIPLGGSKKGVVRTYVNMMLVFIISGIWHGANWTFILWGVLNGFICVIERIFSKKIDTLHKGFRWLVTFGIINVLWLLFRAESVSQWLSILKNILKLTSTELSSEMLACFAIPEITSLLQMPILSRLAAINGIAMLIMLAAALLCVLCTKNTNERSYRITVISAVGSALILVWCICSLGKVSTFVYFGF